MLDKALPILFCELNGAYNYDRMTIKGNTKNLAYGNSKVFSNSIWGHDQCTL